MNDFQRGTDFGLKLASELEKSLMKSPTSFATIAEWEGYNRGILDYQEEILKLLEG